MYLSNKYENKLKPIVNKEEHHEDYGKFYEIVDAKVKHIEDNSSNNLTISEVKNSVKYLNQYVDSTFEVGFNKGDKINIDHALRIKLPIESLGINNANSIIGVKFLGFEIDNSLTVYEISAIKKNIFKYEKNIYINILDLDVLKNVNIDDLKFIIRVTYNS